MGSEYTMWVNFLIYLFTAFEHLTHKNIPTLVKNLLALDSRLSTLDSQLSTSKFLTEDS